ncbi:PAS domain-containing protein [Gephyromycinifex aptenodytis]|uniref:PAS domain-containing protein n=1 Tax=Gephyromycinifex aptenodytis TaxID=2716227 RepID=UPI001447C879|nr:PAS domain-containing protein [Gephyromycinifex aptenodytis]
MRTEAIRPTGVSRTFGVEEIIVSKTDTAGRITYANDVFLRVAGYTWEELIGAPHNIIRHPDMPGGVFKLLWDTLNAGQEIFAYVNNLARDGANYWVLAHVTPTFDGSGRIVGHHSSRRRPAQAAVAAIEPVYATLRAEERRHSGSVAAANASAAMLASILAEREQSYEQFIWSLINPAGVMA